MSLQLYQTEDHNYLLDFQNLPTLKTGDATEADDDLPTTHSLEFFELCSTFIAVCMVPLHSDTSLTLPWQELGHG